MVLDKRVSNSMWKICLLPRSWERISQENRHTYALTASQLITSLFLNPSLPICCDQRLSKALFVYHFTTSQKRSKLEMISSFTPLLWAPSISLKHTTRSNKNCAHNNLSTQAKAQICFSDHAVLGRSMTLLKYTSVVQAMHAHSSLIKMLRKNFLNSVRLLLYQNNKERQRKKEGKGKSEWGKF